MAGAGFLIIVFVPASGNDPEHGLLALTVLLWALFADFAIDSFAAPPEPGGSGILARLRYRLALWALYATALLALVLLLLIAGLTVRAVRVVLGV